MRELVIYCGGYPEVEITLYLATHNWQDSSINIVIPSTHPDLFKFFQVINEKIFDTTLKLISQEMYPARRAKVKGLKKALYILPDIIGERRCLKDFFDKYFAGLKEAEVYFSGQSFAEDRFYLLKRLSKANRLVYMRAPNEVFPVEEYIPTNIVDLAQLIIWKLVYGRDIVMGRIPYVKFASIPDKFIKKQVDRVIDKEERREMTRDLDLSRFKEIFDTGKYSVIYFHQDLLQEGYISNGDTFRRELAEIFNILSKYFPENRVALKYHPCYPGDKTMVTYGEAMEDFIPGELLHNDNVKMYLSLFSCALANVRKGLAVSIANLITFRDDETREQLKEMVIGISRSEILFPKSLDEFEEILMKLCSVRGK